MMGVTGEWAGWVVAIVGAIITAAAAARFLWRKIKSFFSKGNAALETVLGRDAILHPDTGAVLVPETPSLGARMASLEVALVTVAETNRAVVEVQHSVVSLVDRVGRVEEDLSAHIADSARAVELRAREQIQMWSAVEAVAMSSPPDTETDTTD